MSEILKHEQPTFAAGYADLSRAVIVAPVEKIEGINPQKRITLARLAAEQGMVLGSDGIATPDSDSELQVSKEDYQTASPDFIRQGLYIDITDPRYRDKATQQLLWAWGTPPVSPKAIQTLRLERTGVVVPPDEFKIVAHSPPRIAKFAEATTRNANKNELDRKEVDEKVGRSAAHAMESKIERMTGLEVDLRGEIALLRIPFREAASTWIAHFKASKMDAIRREADERIHEMVEVATINLNPGSFELRALHRAIAKKLYRSLSREEIALQWRVYTYLAGQYATARLVKVLQSKAKSEKLLEFYRPYLERAAQAEVDASELAAAA